MTKHIYKGGITPLFPGHSSVTCTAPDATACQAGRTLGAATQRKSSETLNLEAFHPPEHLITNAPRADSSGVSHCSHGRHRDFHARLGDERLGGGRVIALQGAVQSLSLQWYSGLESAVKAGIPSPSHPIVPASRRARRERTQFLPLEHLYCL